MIKTRTFRDRFLMSDVNLATFTIAGTGLARKAYPEGFSAPRFSVSAVDRNLRIENGSGLELDLEMVDVSGQTRLRYSSADAKAELALGTLLPGIYFVESHSAGVHQVTRVYLP